MSKRTASNLKIALVGASGRMGVEIQNLAASSRIEIGAQIDESRQWTKVDAKAIDVVVDFSSSEGLRQALKWCLKHDKKLVSGSTGLSTEDRESLKRAAKDIAILYSANMSLGIAVMTSMLRSYQAVEDWDFQIEEAHHKLKKDSPSGTALLLQDRLSEVLKKKLPKPLSVRGGGIPGTHTVLGMGLDETLVIQHTAFNRQVFARGALRAARWLFDKDQPGLYDLTDLYQAN